MYYQRPLHQTQSAISNGPRYFPVWLIAVIVALLLLGSNTALAQPAPPQLTPAKWQADLDFLSDALVRQHPNPFRRTPKEDVLAAIKQLREQIPSLNEDEIVVGLMRVMALIRDGHTKILPTNYLRSGIYPVRFYLFADGLFVRQASSDYRDAVGSRVTRIGHLNVSEALSRMNQISWADNQMGVAELAPMLLSMPELLHGLGINPDKQTLKLAVEISGKEKIFEVKPTASLHDLIQPPTSWIDARGTAPEPPLYRKNPGNLYWFEYIPGQKLLYIQQNAVQNKPDESIAAFYRRVFDFVGRNPVEKLVLDLRNNDGGNNGLNREVVIDIVKSKLDERGKFFVITGRGTFSAAQNFVNELEKYTKAIFVGEPTAAHPNHYGDATPVTLPNSKLVAHISTLYWQGLDPRDERPWTAPEIAADLTSQDYFSGTDPALQAVLDYQPGSSTADLFNGFNPEAVADFVARYKAFKSDSKHRFVNTEAAMNNLGYTLLRLKKPSEAIEIFKLNTEAYPNSANVYDSLGDALDAAGRKDEAIKSYEKALSIDPNYRSSREALKRLRGN